MARQPRDRYDLNIARLRAFGQGVLEEKDFNPGGVPYRYGTLEVKAPHADAPGLARRMVKLAISVEGYLTCNTFAHECWLQVAISRDVGEGEDAPESERCRWCDEPAREGDDYCSDRCKQDELDDHALEEWKDRRDEGSQP